MHGPGQIAQPQVVECGPGRVEADIAALAARQYGVVATGQLVALGWSQQAVAKRVAAGRLHRVHHGVYAVGHRVLGRHGRWMAAVLAGGPDAVLSHASAAALWEIRASDATWIDITVPRTGRRSRAGLRVHRPRRLSPEEVTTRHGIPVTSAARTVLDMAGRLPPTRLYRLLDQVEIRELTDYPALAAVAAAHAGHPGASKLRQALRSHDAGSDVTKSDLEALFLGLCRHHGLPAPRVNLTIAGQEVDFLFADDLLVVETDSWRYHKTRRAFENDRARDARLARAGYRTLRFTDRQLEREPGMVAETVRSHVTRP
jgi:very-short-patch-repair endonuclease